MNGKPQQAYTTQINKTFIRKLPAFTPEPSAQDFFFRIEYCISLGDRSVD